MSARVTPAFAVASASLLAALAAAFPAQAATGDTVVVTATRQVQRANELLSDVTVVEREEIAQAGPTATVADILARQPGIEITSRGGPGTTGGVMLRGANSAHTLVLVDGIRVASATLADVSWGFLPLNQIDHIEILRGPASSLYGADAIGGVIQIFTRRGEGPLRTNAEVGVGSWNTSLVSAGLSGSQEGWRYSLQASDNRSHSFSAINNPKNSSYNADKDGFQDSSASASLSYAVASGHELGINLLESDGWNRYDSSPKASDWKQKQTVSGVSAYSRNRFLPDWTSTLRLGRGTDNSRQFQDGNPSSTLRTDQDQIQWQNDIKLPYGTALLAAERLQQKVSGDTAYSVNQRTINSLLAGWNGRFGAHSLQLNARRDDNSQFGGKSTGVLAYGYQLAPAWRANAAYGTAFKAPSFNDLYWPGSGNPNLQPERATNREVAVHFEQAGQQASATYYRNRISNLIDWAPGANGLWAPANINNARLTGLTLAYAGNVGAYALRANVDLQDPRDTGTDKLLRYRAEQHAFFAANRSFGRWQWGAELSASGKRYNDVANTQVLGGYALVNLQVSYQLEHDLSLFARANNVFDRDYALVRDFATPGANVFVGLRYQPK
jgi:vitamin B12 transporter